MGHALSQCSTGVFISVSYRCSVTSHTINDEDTALSLLVCYKGVPVVLEFVPIVSVSRVFLEGERASARLGVGLM